MSLKAILIYGFPSPLSISSLKKQETFLRKFFFVGWLCWKCLVSGEVLTIKFYLLTLEFFIVGSAAESKGFGFVCT